MVIQLWDRGCSADRFGSRWPGISALLISHSAQRDTTRVALVDRRDLLLCALRRTIAMPVTTETEVE